MMGLALVIDPLQSALDHLPSASQQRKEGSNLHFEKTSLFSAVLPLPHLSKFYDTSLLKMLMMLFEWQEANFWLFIA